MATAEATESTREFSADTKELGDWLASNMRKLQEDVLQERYQVQELRKVAIPKPNGGTRQLSIPTVKDRLLQQAVQFKLSILYDPYFSESSFGFRAGKSAHDAITQATAYVSQGKHWVVDLDLENFFDRVNHDILMGRVAPSLMGISGSKALFIAMKT